MGGYPGTGRLLQRDPAGQCAMRHPTDPWDFGDREPAVGLSSRVCPPATRPKRREGAPKNRLDRGTVLIDGHYGRQPAVSPSAVLTSSTRKPQVFKRLAANC